MFNLGGMEILVILVVALLVLGPEKLPKFMRTVGRAVGELRRVSTEFQRTLNVDLSTGDEKTVPNLADPERAADESAAVAPHQDPTPALPAAEAALEASLADTVPAKRKSVLRARTVRRLRPRLRADCKETDTP